MKSLRGCGRKESAMDRAIVNGKHLTDQEIQEQQRRQLEQEQQVRQRAEALVRKIGETCDELERLAEENPELVGRVTRGSEEHKDAYLRLKARLALADATPRCRWVRQDGTSCGSPQLKKHIYCFAHVQMMEARALALSLPALEDANAIQIGIMRIQKALIEGTISTKTAGLLLYSMQLALQNVGRVTFGQAKTEEPVRETVSEMEAFSNQHSAVSQNQTQNQTFETQRNGGSGGAEGLPRMDAGERGLESRRRPVEWRPTADMYRMDTREGMEAYEASFRMKIGASGHRDIESSGHLANGTPLRAAVPHEHDGTHDPSQMRANLG